MLLWRSSGFLGASLLLLASVLSAQPPSPTAFRWTAFWIDVPGTAPDGYGVYHFRRSFELPAVPSTFVVHVSGDNRYQLFVNGARVSWGPARGDLTHWRYETIDIASHLHAGRNVLAAVVWNDGPLRAVAQVSNQTGLLLQADAPENAIVNSGKSWLSAVDKAYSLRPLAPDQRTGYTAVGANENLDSKLYPWGWEKPGFDDSTWLPAHEVTRGAARDSRDAPNRWMLVQSAIPLEEQSPEPPLLQRTNRNTGFPKRPVTIPPHTQTSLLLDQTYLTTAYPELTMSGGENAQVDLGYAETLYIVEPGKRPVKGNRNDVEGRQFIGTSDHYLADGGSHRVYRPLFWRTFRYLNLAIKTADQPLTIETMGSTFSAYPFEPSASFQVADAATNESVQKILSTGWRTARLCAHETYMDCPYYEQLQYGGDARIQMMVSLYMTGDARLMKNGISLLNSSRTAEGATYSRAPSALQQYIPPFSLWWIGMVHDYWMYVDDAGFVKQMLPGVHGVLSFYSNYQGAQGSLRKMPWWNFVDWVKQWEAGEPPAEPNGSSAAALDLQLLLAYQWASDLDSALGSKALAEEYRTAAQRLQSTIEMTDWDAQRNLFADQPSHRTYSQHVNTLAILAGLGTPTMRQIVMRNIIQDKSLAQSSIYFRAYTNAALRLTGMGDQYLAALDPWREMLEQGLTTWAEWNGPDVRSDCHAWGASPNFEMLRTIAGIESSAPGFRSVRIAPNLGQLKEVTARMPHPKGAIEVKFIQGKTADVRLPDGINGELVAGGKTIPLHPGQNHLRLQ